MNQSPAPAPMMTEITAAGTPVRGVSLGGVYTSIHVPELHALFDVGMALRSTGASRYLFLSHGHVDHVGALPALLGLRELTGVRKPLTVFMPEAIEEIVKDTLEVISRMHRWPLEVKTVPMAPGDELKLHADLRVRAFRTWHTVPSLGYLFFRRVNKLKPEFSHLPGAEIGRLRREGAPIFNVVERPALAFATDTLPRVLETTPELLEVPTLIMECTFLDDRKPLSAAHAGCHVHLDDLIPIADEFKNEALVLMHFSQLYSPREVPRILKTRCPPALFERIVPFVPDAEHWPG